MNGNWTTWWNLIFEVPVLLAIVYLMIYTASGWTFGDADVDHDCDLDHDCDVDHDAAVDQDAAVDHDVDHDVEADHDVETDHDSAAEHDADSEHDAAAPVWLAVISWLGVGRVPVSIVLTVMALSWGVSGFAANRVLGGNAPWGAAIPIALLVSAISTHLMTAAVARFLPLNETYAIRRHELLGMVGEAMYDIDDSFGLVSVRDRHGNLFQVPCRSARGVTKLPKGSKVALAGYSKDEQMFYGEPP